ncbi:TRAP transporter small permease [Oricola indica]|jgi:TRAP-type C4-dicarboxylate transport system permease small subunit|uniref:TRAP transporter small permease n=1 Tax=Oricola indica TaxID=2872591 RepID=UPI001CBF9145|nr:TRAP transporter small permease subunit [Oricola indica]
MNRPVEWICSLFADLGAILVFVAGALIVVDVVLRMVFGSPFAGTADLVAIALVLVTFLQAGKALLQGRLLQITLLLDKLPLKLQQAAMVAANIVGAGLFIGLAYISIEPIRQSIENHEFFGTDAFRVTAWPIRISVAVLWVVLGIAFLVKAFDRRRELPQ